MTPFSNRRVLWFTIAAVGIMIVFRIIATRPSPEQRAKAAAMAAALRVDLLARKSIAGLPPKPGAIRGVVMDWGLGRGLATMVAIDDGSVSLYMNPGGGIIGAGTKPEVAAAAQRFRAEAERVRNQFTARTSFPKPANDSVVFYLITDSETLGSSPIDWTTGSQSSPLGPLNQAAQALMTQIRKAS